MLNLVGKIAGSFKIIHFVGYSSFSPIPDYAKWLGICKKCGFAQELSQHRILSGSPQYCKKCLEQELSDQHQLAEALKIIGNHIIKQDQKIRRLEECLENQNL